MGFEEKGSLKKGGAAMMPWAGQSEDVNNVFKLGGCIFLAFSIILLCLVIYSLFNISGYNTIVSGAILIIITLIFAFKEEFVRMLPVGSTNDFFIIENENYLEITDIHVFGTTKKCIFSAEIRNDFILYSSAGDTTEFCIDRKNNIVIFSINDSKYQGNIKKRVR